MSLLSNLKSKIFSSSSSSSSTTSSSKRTKSVNEDAATNYGVVRHYVPVTYANSPKVDRHAPPTIVNDGQQKDEGKN